MNLLLINAYFTPEVIAFTHLEKDLIEGLLSAGHRLSVLCPTPTRGIDAETARVYRSIKNEEIYDGCVSVRRFFAPREGRNPLVRAFRYFWCNLRQYQLGKRYTDIDVVFCVSTPPTQGWLCAKVAKRLSKKYGRKVPFVYSLQDIFPNSLVTTGLTKKDSLLWKIGRKIENYTYAHADKIIVISESMKKNIMEKGVPEDKVVVVSNWIDTEVTRPVPKQENRLFEEFGIPHDKFIVVYAGNFGKAQGAHVVLDAAEQLKNEANVQFVIFGGGAGFEAAKTTVSEKGLTNVIINGLLSQERVPEVYSLGDVALITCKKGVGNSGMPSKTWSIMACDTPIIAAFDTDSELSEILARTDAGVSVEPQDPEALVEAIVAMKNADQRPQGGRAFVCEHADKKVCVVKYVEILKNCVDNVK